MCFERWQIRVVTGLLAGLSAGVTLLPGAESLEESRRELEGLSATEKLDLQQKEQRFTRLSPQEQDRLRKLHRDITQDAQAGHLQHLMEHYTRWLNTLPSGQRAEVLSLPPQERIAKIKQLMRQQATTGFGHLVSQELTDEDLEAILAWLDELVARREKELLAKNPQLEERLRPISDPRRRRMMLYWSLRFRSLRDVVPPDPDDLERLKEHLSPKARQAMEKAAAAGNLAELAQRWTQAALFSKKALPPVDPEELRRFYHEKLDARQREYLESLPAQRMQFVLTMMFYGQYAPPFGSGDPSKFRGPFGPRGFGTHKPPGDRPLGPNGSGKASSERPPGPGGFGFPRAPGAKPPFGREEHREPQPQEPAAKEDPAQQDTGTNKAPDAAD
jgi:hypothetical protein